MFRNKSVDTHSFAMVPRADVPRSSFRMERGLKTTFDAGYLVPFFLEEVLPGDSFRVSMTAFCRMATPIFPIMDNLTFETFFFFVPNRLVWSNWVKFMGEQENPGDSTSYVVPTVSSPSLGYDVCSLGDYFGLPALGQVAGAIKSSSLPFRGYNLIWNEWFRDENLQTSVLVPKGDGPDSNSNFTLLRRGKRKDYFTSCLPWTQKGSSVMLPLGTSAPVVPSAVGAAPSFTGGGVAGSHLSFQSGTKATSWNLAGTPTGTPTGTAVAVWDSTGLSADLSAATAATINQIRQAFQVQKLLERDARGGTRYTELLRAHFGVQSPDARLQRPEYLGGGSSPVLIHPVERNSAPTSESAAPQGTLAGFGTMVARHGFQSSFVEHGYVIGLMSVRADLSYSQGMRRHWSRSTRYDYYFPAFAMLGEQPVYRKELFATGVPAQDDAVFGYQERWGEYRYSVSELTGMFRVRAGMGLDSWHLSQNFVSPPTLNSTFIQDTPPVSRVVSAGVLADGQQFLFDSVTDIRAVRPLPMFSVPGLVDHF